MRYFAEAVRFASRVSGIVSVLLILLAILIVCQMIFVRKVLGESSIWQTEFVTFSLIAATFLGAPHILLTRGHVAVDLLPMLLKHRARVALAIFASLLALCFCLLVLWTSVSWWHEAFAGNHLTSSMWRAPLWVPYLSVPVGMGLISLQYVCDIWALATGRDLPFGMKPDEKL